MNCIDTQRLIMPFINNQLDIIELEGFVNHVNTCPNCMEELEVYYVLLAGMKQLDEDKELSDNFHLDLIDILKQSEEHIFRDKISHIRKRIFLIVTITLVAIISSFRFGEYVVEDVLHKEVTESNYSMENLFIKYNPELRAYPTKADNNKTLSTMTSENLMDIYIYLIETDSKGAKKMKEHFEDQIWQGIKMPDKIGLQLRLLDRAIVSY